MNLTWLTPRQFRQVFDTRHAGYAPVKLTQYLKNPWSPVGQQWLLISELAIKTWRRALPFVQGPFQRALEGRREGFRRRLRLRRLIPRHNPPMLLATSGSREIQRVFQSTA